MRTLLLTASFCSLLLTTAGCASVSSTGKVRYETPKEHVVHVTDYDFEAKVLKDGPALVEFWAAYCPSCKKMHPVMEELARELEGRARVVMVDIKTNRKWAARYDIKLIPTFIYFENGEVSSKAVGAMPKEKLKEKLGID